MNAAAKSVYYFGFYLLILSATQFLAITIYAARNERGVDPGGGRARL